MKTAFTIENAIAAIGCKYLTNFKGLNLILNGMTLINYLFQKHHLLSIPQA